MKLQHALLLLFGFIAFTHATISEDATCPKDCSGHGHCIDGKQPACSCDAGYFLDDCSLDLNHNRYVVVAEVFYGLLFFCLLYLCGYVFISKPTDNTTTFLTPISNMRKIAFACVAIVCMSQLAFLVDPLHVHGIYPRIAVQILYCIPYLMFLLIFLATLFHWVELINTSVHRMNKEAMLQKINKTYQPKEVTVEEVIEQVKFLRKKLLIPFSIVTGILFTLILAFSVLIGLEFREYAMLLGLQAVVSVYWMAVFIGFIIYGRKLEDLMPHQLFEKVHQLWHRLALMSAYFFIITIAIFVGFATTGRNDPVSFVSLCLIHEAFLVISCMLTLCIYIHWESHFPFLFTIRLKESRQSSINALSPQASDISITLPIELTPSLARTFSSLKINRTGVDFTSPHNSSSSFYGESPSNEGSPNGGSPIGRSRSNTPLNKAYLAAIREPSDNDILMHSISIYKNSPEGTANNEEDTEPATEADDLSETSEDSQKTEPQTPPPKPEPFDWLAVGTGRKIEYPNVLTKSFSLRDGTIPASAATTDHQVA